jgi:N-acetylmuramoyl-L-alanine amidase
LLFLTNNCFSSDKKNSVKKINFSDNSIKISLALKGSYKNFILENPDRLVIDIENCDFEEKTAKINLPTFVKQIRFSKNNNYLRLVFDLNHSINVKKTTLSKAKNSDLFEISINFLKNKNEQNFKFVKKAERKNNLALITKSKKYIIVIDAGHGGKDPGAIGRFYKTKEKNITLTYARDLKKKIEKNKKFKVYLTRNSDIFLSLKKRVELSRKLKADLFISIHANSIDSSSTSGFSIYTLSEKSSDKQAEILARKENQVDIISGMNFQNTSQDIVKTLIDLSQRDTMNNSAKFANLVIKKIKKTEIEILQNTHRFAGFAVLTAPDVASVLIELGYLSNRREEKKLSDDIYKNKITNSLLIAIEEFFKN